MQLKSFLLTIGLFSYAMNVGAQQAKTIVMQAPPHIIKTDTIVKTTIGGGRAQLLATNASPAQEKFKGVPLAGHKAYYGSMCEFVNGYVRKYLGAHSKTLARVDDRSKKKFSTIEHILTKHNIPKELKYLAVIESALNNKALSPVGALGPWQLMETTAQMMGLTVNEKRDDRTDWIKSTNAAAKYLNVLYRDLNDWLLVVAAYNSGPVPVNRAIQKTGSRSFWDIKKHLPRETQGHVLAFIATASIFEKMRNYIGVGSLPDDFLFGNEENSIDATANKLPPRPRFTEDELKSMAIVRVSEHYSLDFLAEELGVNKKLINDWNDDYDLFLDGNYDGEYYGLRIPKDKLDSFIQKKPMLVRKSKEILEDMGL